MKTFLQYVAEDLYKKVGADLSKVAVVFPNKRAGLFFNEHISACSQTPVWAPAYISISELFQKMSTLKLGDPVSMVCRLYRIFQEETGSKEALDDFYFWGELLIGDFDDLDKNLVDADKLLTNLEDLRNLMDGYDFLDEEQEEALKLFFRNFSPEKSSELKSKFTSLWERLGTIYHRFRQSLADSGIAYEGMLYRDVLESLDLSALPYEKYVFVGFNVLNKVEHQFFAKLRDAGKAWFYWDYDVFYTQTLNNFRHEAGEFVLRNLKEFPNELTDSAIFTNLGRPKKVRYISASTENAQARYLLKWAREEKTEPERENAVVLCNEALLLPVLHSLPSEVENVNVTMGFPLAQTPVFSFVNALLELQTDGYCKDTGRYRFEAVCTVLKHPYVCRMSSHADVLVRELTRNNTFYPLPSALQTDDFLKVVFTPVEGIHDLCAYLSARLKEVSVLYRKEEDKTDIFDQLYRESLFKAFTMTGRLLTLIEGGELVVRVGTFKMLLNRLMGAANIPFHGEPAVGMQVMGVLETRNLDFRNLLILSLNEGQLPKAGGDSSFIPYNLRKAFGMTTIEHKNAVYAYYFYRLIQRAENITLMYNTSSEGLNRGEWSRFMLQFLVEWPHEIRREYLEAGQSPLSRQELSVGKTEQVMQRLLNRFDIGQKNPEKEQVPVLSPSALNTYLDCRLKFYLRYVAGLKEPEEVSAEIDSAKFGTIFHYSAELVYRDLCQHGKMIQKSDLEQLLKEEGRIQNYVDRAFKKHFFHVGEQEKPEYNGTQIINSKVIVSYLRQLLRNDLNYAPFRMEAMEKPVYEEKQVNTVLGPLQLALGGTIDRMDSKEGTLRIVDYKTGGTPKSVNSVAELFDLEQEKRANYIFQTFLYAAIVCRQESFRIAPSLLYIHQASNQDYSPVIKIGEPRKKQVVEDFAEYESDFREQLDALIQEIFCSDEPFCQTQVTSRCSYCEFINLCKR